MRPDIQRLEGSRSLDDPGPETLLRFDGAQGVAMEQLLRAAAAGGEGWHAVDPTVPAELWWRVAAAAAVRLERDGDPRARLRRTPQGEVLEFPFLGVRLRTPEAPELEAIELHPETPCDLARSSAALQRALAQLPPASRALDALRFAVSEDLVVLRRDGGAAYLAVAAPSGWDPSERLGASFAALHERVPENDLLLRAAERMVDAMLGKGPFVRYVWTLSGDDSLSRHPTRSPAAPLPIHPQRWWWRAERQTTLPVPEAGAALFAIRVLLAPLSEVLAGPSRRERLSAALSTMSDELLRYKGFTLPRAELSAALQSLSSEPPKVTLSVAETEPTATTSSVSRS